MNLNSLNPLSEIQIEEDRTMAKKKSSAKPAIVSNSDAKIACLSENAKLFNILLSKACFSTDSLCPGEFVVLRSNENEVKV